MARQRPVAREAVGDHGRALLDDLLDERTERLGLEVVNLPQPHAARAETALLDRDDHLRLRLRQPSAHTRLIAADERLINLDVALELS